MISRHLAILSLIIYSVVAKSAVATTPTTTIAAILPQSTLAMDWGIDWGADVPYWKNPIESTSTIIVIVPASSPILVSVAAKLDFVKAAQELNVQLSVLEAPLPTSISHIPSTPTSLSISMLSSIPTLVASKMAKIQNRYRSNAKREARIS